jgi:hypothetical protein
MFKCYALRFCQLQFLGVKSLITNLQLCKSCLFFLIHFLTNTFMDNYALLYPFYNQLENHSSQKVHN